LRCSQQDEVAKKTSIKLQKSYRYAKVSAECYAVQSGVKKELLKELAKHGPKDQFLNVRYAKTAWRLKPYQDTSKIVADVTLTMPCLVGNFSWHSSNDEVKWSQMWSRLLKHELRHINDIERRLLEYNSKRIAKSARLTQHIKELSSLIRSDSHLYDQETKHGLLEGINL
jgi:hypothetical protein